MKFTFLFKSFLLLFLLLPVWNSISCFTLNNCDGGSIMLKETKVQQTPKSSYIEASVNGHYVSVSFTANLGNATIVVTTATGGTVDVTDYFTPNFYSAYIPNTGDYVLTIIFDDGDEYFGEFEVTDY